MAASLRAAAVATRILHLPGEGLRFLVHTNPQPQHSTPARALEEGYRGSQIQQKKEKLYAASQPHRRPMTSAKKWTAAALVGVAGAIAVGAIATGDGAEDWPHCYRYGGSIPRECVLCGQKLPRPVAEAMQAASKCGQASGAAENQKEAAEVK